jgi:polyhydroxybutyrate depolymerase
VSTSNSGARAWRLVVACVAVVLLAACGSANSAAETSASSAPPAGAAAPGAPTGSPPGTAPASTTSAAVSTSLSDAGSIRLDGNVRPAELVAPSQVSGPTPLLVVLHGFGSNADEVNRFFGATEQAAPRGLYLLLPEGTKDKTGRQFWDATAACCNFTGTPVDDVGYVRSLIDEAVAKRPIDQSRIYVLGHSNGGFMSYRLACELADKITAVAVFAGSEATTATDCAPARPVSVLHVHGRADRSVPYIGGKFSAVFPGAEETTARWAARDGCGADTIDGPKADLDTGVAGAETSVRTYQGCPVGIDVQLDTIDGGEHSPPLNHGAVGTDIFDWLLAHSR